jgi:hypothetical protein
VELPQIMEVKLVVSEWDWESQALEWRLGKYEWASEGAAVKTLMFISRAI